MTSDRRFPNTHERPPFVIERPSSGIYRYLARGGLYTEPRWDSYDRARRIASWRELYKCMEWLDLDGESGQRARTVRDVDDERARTSPGFTQGRRTIPETPSALSESIRVSV